MSDLYFHYHPPHITCAMIGKEGNLAVAQLAMPQSLAQQAQLPLIATSQGDD